MISNQLAICCTNFKQQSTSPVFTRQNTFEKNLQLEIFIVQIIGFELRGRGPSLYLYSWNWLIHDNWQHKNLLGKSSSELLFTAKRIAEGNVPCSPPIWA